MPSTTSTTAAFAVVPSSSCSGDPVTMKADYEVYALRYASSFGRRGEKFHRYVEDHPEDAEQGIRLDFYFWLVRNEERIVLVDCGFDQEATLPAGYRVGAHPLELLDRLGVAPGDVDHVVLTHMHFDHIGNIGLFPRATFILARSEYAFWTGPLASRPHIGVAGLPHEIAAVTQLEQAGRLRFVEGDEEIFPGMTVMPRRGHTPGQLLTSISTGRGRVVLASDASHLYEEMEGDLPFWLFVDLEGMYRTLDLLRDLQARDDTVVVPGHDPAVLERFALVAEDCVDLRQPVRP
jgi:glyoxylase-like metal-dependent hydrolase (beta-lactamase superfamily II)